MDTNEWPSTCGETSLIRKRLQGRALPNLRCELLEGSHATQSVQQVFTGVGKQVRNAPCAMYVGYAVSLRLPFVRIEAWRKDCERVASLW